MLTLVKEFDVLEQFGTHSASCLRNIRFHLGQVQLVGEKLIVSALGAAEQIDAEEKRPVL